MAPYAAEMEAILDKDEQLLPALNAPQADDWKFQLSYFNIVAFGYWFAAGFYGGYLALTSAKWATLAFNAVSLYFSLLGVLAGAHRLWSHKSYKAKMPLQIILMLFNTLAGQYSAFDWVRNHRLHHKHSDTDADPYNATRGFFFSHIGWLFVVKHPEVKKRGISIDMSDIISNPVLVFQRKYAAVLFTLICYVLPTVIPMYFWNETLSNSWHVNLFRFIMCLNIIGLVNSAAHKFGNKPFDKSILPVENQFISLLTMGECFHNYHHTFPWDYHTAEYGNQAYSLTTKFIDFFARFGWAYDMKTVDREMIIKRAERTGDGSYEYNVCGVKSGQSSKPCIM